MTQMKATENTNYNTVTAAHELKLCIILLYRGMYNGTQKLKIFHIFTFICSYINRLLAVFFFFAARICLCFSLTNMSTQFSIKIKKKTTKTFAAINVCNIDAKS